LHRFWGQPAVDTLVRLAGSGDLNGDGISDIVVESLTSVNPAMKTAWVFFGAPLRVPVIAGAQFGQAQLVVMGTDFTGAARLEVNGTVLSLKPTFKPDKGKLIYAGSEQDLGLHSGKNTIAIIRGTARFNTVKLRL
jgi:hypothetical protein